MKELTMPRDVYLEEYDLNVRPYLTMEEIMSIGNLAVQTDNVLEQEMTIAMNVLICCTNLNVEDFQQTDERVDVLDISDLMIAGVWESVKKEVANITLVYDYVDYFQSPQIAIAKFLNTTLPNMVDKYVDRLPKDGEWEGVLEQLPSSLIEVLNIAKEDGNADIIRGALKMGESDGD